MNYRQVIIFILLASALLWGARLLIGNLREDEVPPPAPKSAPVPTEPTHEAPARHSQKPMLAETQAPEFFESDETLDEIAASLPGCTGWEEAKIAVRR